MNRLNPKHQLFLSVGVACLEHRIWGNKAGERSVRSVGGSFTARGIILRAKSLRSNPDLVGRVMFPTPFVSPRP